MLTFSHFGGEKGDRKNSVNLLNPTLKGIGEGEGFFWTCKKGGRDQRFLKALAWEESNQKKKREVNEPVSPFPAFTF